MEYTNDIILNIKYKGDKKKENLKVKHRVLKTIIKKIYDDEFFTISILVSIIVLIIDFLFVKHFIKILNLL